MRTPTSALGSVVVAVVLATPAAAQTAAPAPSFSKDVAPIFYKSCVACHRPTMFAPMSLMTHDAARPWARSIRQRVADRSMPPWNADRAHGTFKNDPSLSDGEVATILAWVDAGAPRGDDRDLPTPPVFAEGWGIGKPDVVFAMPAPFAIPAAGEIPYQYMRIPTGLTKDAWIQALEIRSSSRQHVHHVIAYTQPRIRPCRPTARSAPGTSAGRRPTSPAWSIRTASRGCCGPAPTSCCRCTTRPTARPMSTRPRSA